MSAAFFSKILVSSLFVSHRTLDDALENSIYLYFALTGNRPEDITKLEVDRLSGEVRLSLNNGPLRVARYYGDQGCVIIPLGQDDVFFEPVKIVRSLTDDDTTPWPSGNLNVPGDYPQGVDRKLLNAGVEEMFNEDSHTAAVVVFYKAMPMINSFPGKVSRSILWKWDQEPLALSRISYLTTKRLSATWYCVFGRWTC